MGVPDWDPRSILMYLETKMQKGSPSPSPRKKHCLRTRLGSWDGLPAVMSPKSDSMTPLEHKWLETLLGQIKSLQKDLRNALAREEGRKKSKSAVVRSIRHPRKRRATVV